MFNVKTEFYLKFIFLISLISIIFAYFVEHVLGHQPCNLCLIERIPYIVCIILLTANYALKINEKIIIFILFLTFVFSFSISVYHFGIEQGFFKESAVCEQKNAMDIISKEELLKQLSEKNVSCKDVTFRIFGLSLTSINIILSLIITILLINIYKKYEKIKS